MLLNDEEFDRIQATSSYLNRRRRSLAELAIDSVIDQVGITPEPGTVLEFLENARRRLNK